MHLEVNLSAIFEYKKLYNSHNNLKRSIPI